MDEQFNPTLFTSEEEFKNAQDLFASAKKQHLEGNPVGTFQARIESAELAKSTSSGRLQIVYALKIVAGPNADKTVPKYDGLSSPEQAKIAMDSLKRLGINTEKLTLDTLPATLLTIKDMLVSIQCKQNGQYYNVNFLKPIRQTDPGTTQPKATATSKKKF